MNTNENVFPSFENADLIVQTYQERTIMRESTEEERSKFIPILIGIVGHRDLTHSVVSEIEKSLEMIFEEFDEAFQNTPKVLLSSLAPGADLLAAKIALARGKNWTVRVPLPCPVDEYLSSDSFRLKHFELTERQREEQLAVGQFNNLLRNPQVESFVVPLPKTTSSKDENYDIICYANAGGYIVRHCHTVIALWDKEKLRLPSGTADLVRFQLSGLAPEHYPWTSLEPLGFDSDRGPVIVINTPRTGHLNPDSGKITVRLPSEKIHETYGKPEVGRPQLARRITRRERFLHRVKELWGYPSSNQFPEYDQFLTICQNIDDFNRDAAKLKPHDEVYGETFTNRLERASDYVKTIFPASDPTVTLPTLRNWFDRILTVKSVADHLSGGFLNSIWKNGTFWLFTMLFITLALQHLYAHPVWHTDHTGVPKTQYGVRSGLLVAILFLWLSMLGFAGVIWYYRWDNRRLDYRALSEALRVREAWSIAGIGQSVSGSYLPQLRSELAWIRRALQHICPPPEYWEMQFNELSPERKLSRITSMQNEWIKGQIKYFEGARKREYHDGIRLKKWGFFTAIAGYFAMLMMFPLGYLNKQFQLPWIPSPEEPTHYWLIIFGLLFVFGAIRIALSERRGHEVLAKQYDHMFTVFSTANRELEAILNPALLTTLRECDGIKEFSGSPPVDPAMIDFDRAKRVIESLGREAILEHSQWLLLHRSKPMELPLG